MKREGLFWKGLNTRMRARWRDRKTRNRNMNIGRTVERVKYTKMRDKETEGEGK